MAAGTILAAALLTAWVLWPILRGTREPQNVAAPAAARAPMDPQCPRCGPRPESDARYCSTCGAPIQ